MPADGQRAVEVFKENSKTIDGVILDMRLPVLSARDAYFEMRKIKPEIRVLLTTGYGNNLEVQELIGLGIRGVLLKPFNMKEIEALVGELLK